MSRDSLRAATTFRNIDLNVHKVAESINSSLQRKILLEGWIVGAVRDVEYRSHLPRCVGLHLLEEGLQVDALKRHCLTQNPKPKILDPKTTHLGLPELDLCHGSWIQPLVEIFCRIFAQYLLCLQKKSFQCSF